MVAGIQPGYTEVVNKDIQQEVHDTYGPAPRRDRRYDAIDEQYANDTVEEMEMGHDAEANAPPIDSGNDSDPQVS